MSTRLSRGAGAGVDEWLVVVAAEQPGGAGVDDKCGSHAARLLMPPRAMKIQRVDQWVALVTKLLRHRANSRAGHGRNARVIAERERYGGDMHLGRRRDVGERAVTLSLYRAFR